jgi:hypothetical protein
MIYNLDSLRKRHHDLKAYQHRQTFSLNTLSGTMPSINLDSSCVYHGIAFLEHDGNFKWKSANS